DALHSIRALSPMAMGDRGDVWLARAVSSRQRLRFVPGDDEAAARDRDRRKQRRRGLAALRIPLETGRAGAEAGLCRAAPASARLGGVVRGARRYTQYSVGAEVSLEPGG